MATDDLQTAVRRTDHAVVLDLLGDIDSGAERSLAAGYAEATRDGADTLVLNFDRAGYINSTGIALIVGLLAQARAQKIELRACGLSDHYREIFEITRLSDFMTITETEDGSSHA